MRALLALVLMSGVAAADIDEKGVRAGTLFTGADHDGVKPRFGEIGGAFVVQRFSPYLGLQVEALFEDQRFELQPSGQFMGTFHLYALEVPVLVRLEAVPRRFYFAAGFDPVLSLGANSTVTDTVRIDEVKTFNIAVAVGLGLEIPAGVGRFTIDARYRHLLSDLAETANFISEPGSLKQSHMIVVAVGYGFP